MGKATSEKKFSIICIDKTDKENFGKITKGLFSIDAKESVATGRFDYYGNKAIGSVYVVPKIDTSSPLAPKTKEVEDENIEKLIKKVMQMNSSELLEVVEKFNFSITDFDKTNLVDKREIVSKMLKDFDEINTDDAENDDL